MLRRGSWAGQADGLECNNLMSSSRHGLASLSLFPFKVIVTTATSSIAIYLVASPSGSFFRTWAAAG